MRKKMILILSLIATVFCEEEEDLRSKNKLDEDVIGLTGRNFDAFLKKNPVLLVIFYKFRCEKCDVLASEFAKAAKQLSVPLAKINGVTESGLSTRFNVNEYPSLKFWHKSSDYPQDYDGEYNAEGIVQWVSERIAPDYKPPPEEIVTLTMETFGKFVSSHALVPVIFYAPWCDECKQLTSCFITACKRLKAKNLDVVPAKVDATSEKSLADVHGISDYPTAKVFRNGIANDYDGSPDPREIADFIRELAQSAAKKLSNLEDAQHIIKDWDVSIIGFFGNESSELFNSFMDAAEMTRNEFFWVGYTLEPSIIKYFDAKPDEVIIFIPKKFWSKYEPRRFVYSKGSGSAEELVAFFRDNSVPLVGQRTHINKAIRYSKFPLVVVYYTLDFSKRSYGDTEYWRFKVLEIANKYKNKYRFAISDERQFERELDRAGLGDSSLEHNVILFGSDGKQYPMNPDEFDGNFDENIKNFMEKISSGEVKAYAKSAPLPKNNNGPVKKIVASNFEKVALDEKKDVLILFYEQRCKGCQVFERKYKQLAAKLQSEEPNLVIAKFDAEANDVPWNFRAKRFPAIFFAPAGKKDSPIKYMGSRDLDDLTKFMKEHATVSFKEKIEL